VWLPVTGKNILLYGLRTFTRRCAPSRPTIFHLTVISAVRFASSQSRI
jgi:hypothetical protein